MVKGIRPEAEFRFSRLQGRYLSIDDAKALAGSAGGKEINRAIVNPRIGHDDALGA